MQADSLSSEPPEKSRGILLSHENERNIAIYNSVDDYHIYQVLSEVRKDKHMTSLICGILKNNTNEFIYKIETDLQTYKTKLQLPKRKR